MESHYDVVVIGAGPAGASCAAVLGAAGRRVLLADKARFPREKICGDCVNPRSWPLLERLDVADRVRASRPVPIGRVCIVSRSGRTTTVPVTTAAGEPLFALKRRILDDILLDNARRKGVTVRDGLCVIDVSRDRSWRVVCREMATGREVVYDAERLVGADGRNSLLAARLLPRSVRARKRPERVGVQWRAIRQPGLHGSVELYLFDSGYGGAVDVGGGETTLGLVTSAGRAALARRDHAEFLRATLFTNAVAAARFGDLSPVDGVRFAHPIDPRPHPLADETVVLAGDAFRAPEPFTGEGVLYALRDGTAAADVLLGRREAATLRSRRNDPGSWEGRVLGSLLRHERAAEGIAAASSRAPFVAGALARRILSP